ncbi:hypothetical protein [Klebsiella michiganensis]|uniref:hypothetical protein n=1 Tax=Klebsiella michiganensis TaxID=1134687 RepID=UPI003F50C71A
MFNKHTAIVCAAYFMTAFHVSAHDSSLDGERYRLETTPDSAIQSDDFEGVSRRVDFVESLNKEPILDNLNEVERVIFQIGTAYRSGVDLKKNDFEYPQKIGETFFYRKKGQFFCNNDASRGEGCPVRVKIGTEKPFTIKTRHPADISNNHGLIISPKDAKIIADKITDLVDDDEIPSKDKTMTVILPSYSVGAQKFIFDVSMFYCLPYKRQCK